MVTNYRSFELYSHRDKLLIKHIEEVKNHSLDIANDSSFFIDREELKRLLEIIACCHDFGKASGYFQQKLFGNLQDNKLAEHGLISALFGYYIVEKEDFELLGKEFAKLAAFNIIKHHHGNLRNIEKRLDTIEYGYLLEVVDSICESKSEVERIYSQVLGTGEDILKEFSVFLEEILRDTQFRIKGSALFTRKQRKEGNYDYFFIFNLLYSILLESDKKSASGSEEMESGFRPSERIVNNYKSSFDYGNEFNKIRERIYQEAISQLQAYWRKCKFFEIDAPTGSGKTLTLLGSAFTLSEKIWEEKGRLPKIIYALPFISIIEQNYEVFRKVIEESEGPIGNDILLEHHHLADEIFEAGGREVEYSRSSFLIENWYSDIIVTTFYQLFKSVYTNKNHLLKKYNKLADSIILIDEIQAIPPGLFQAVRDCLKFLSEQLNAYVILGTATQPKLNREDEKQKDKLESKKLFSPLASEQIGQNDIDRFFNRYYLNTSLVNKEVTLEDLPGILEEYLDPTNMMIVLNTISSTKDLYRNLLREAVFEDYEKIYLSTNIPPLQRSKRILKAKKLIDAGEKFILVTTQLIEAGVDISVEQIFRDMAPLDKIVQTAGRTNRNNEKDFSEVVVLNLRDADNKNRSYSSYIYDKLLLAKTKKFLGESGHRIEERGLCNKILPEYFNALINHKSQGTFQTREGNTINLKKEISGLQFEEVERYFKLIQDDLPEVSCFIVQNHDDQDIWGKYVEISEMLTDSWKRYMEKQKMFSEIKQDFNRRIVTLKVGSEEEKVDLVHRIISLSHGEDFRCNNILRIDTDNQELYNKDTGITVKENDSAMIL